MFPVMTVWPSAAFGIFRILFFKREKSMLHHSSIKLPGDRSHMRACRTG
jgi:hypothetical protein